VKVFFDTSVLLAAMLEEHESHRRAFSALERVHSGRDEGLIGAHTLAELYSALTRMPAPFRHSPNEALLSIEENVLKHFRIVTLSGSDYVELIREAASRGIQGGTTYDALLLRTAVKADANRILTLNLKHFHAVAAGKVAELLFAP
jgi:predicted nucleic acid-binding protein